MCGVVGVFSPEGGEEIAQAAYRGAAALQNRGQHGAGLSLIDPGQGIPMQGYRGEGEVAAVIGDRGRLLDLALPAARAALAQTRYPTSGGQGYAGAQPVHLDRYGFVTNGHIENAADVATRFTVPKGEYTTDSQYSGVTMATVAGFYGITGAVEQVAPFHNGAFSSVMSDGHEMVAWRDPWGFRPLSMGRLATGAVVFASETAAFDAMGASQIQDIAPGEIITVHADGAMTSSQIKRDVRPGGGICGLEFAYLANSSSVIGGRSVYLARMEMGRRMAASETVDADCVLGIPNSGTLFALGYAQQSGIPYAHAIERHGTGRSFMKPTQAARAQAARDKFSFVKEAIARKKIVVGDDSLLRGTVGKVNATRLRDMGATEIHARIGSPMIVSICRMGIDIGDVRQLIANQHDRSEARIARAMGFDTVRFIGTEMFRRAIDELDVPGTVSNVGAICLGCVEERYPFDVGYTAPLAFQDVPANASHAN